jgi:hypothetical protein
MCFQVEAKVGILPKHEKKFPPRLYPSHTVLPQFEDNVWDFYLSMKNIALPWLEFLDYYLIYGSH